MKLPKARLENPAGYRAAVDFFGFGARVFHCGRAFRVLL